MASPIALEAPSGSSLPGTASNALYLDYSQPTSNSHNHQNSVPASSVSFDSGIHSSTSSSVSNVHVPPPIPPKNSSTRAHAHAILSARSTATAVSYQEHQSSQLPTSPAPQVPSSAPTSTSLPPLPVASNPTYFALPEMDAALSDPLEAPGALSKVASVREVRNNLRARSAERPSLRARVHPAAAAAAAAANHAAHISAPNPVSSSGISATAMQPKSDFSLAAIPTAAYAENGMSAPAIVAANGGQPAATRDKRPALSNVTETQVRPVLAATASASVTHSRYSSWPANQVGGTSLSLPAGQSPQPPHTPPPAASSQLSSSSGQNSAADAGGRLAPASMSMDTSVRAPQMQSLQNLSSGGVGNGDPATAAAAASGAAAATPKEDALAKQAIKGSLLNISNHVNPAPLPTVLPPSAYASGPPLPPRSWSVRNNHPAPAGPLFPSSRQQPPQGPKGAAPNSFLPPKTSADEPSASASAAHDKDKRTKAPDLLKRSLDLQYKNALNRSGSVQPQRSNFPVHSSASGSSPRAPLSASALAPALSLPVVPPAAPSSASTSTASSTATASVSPSPASAAPQAASATTSDTPSASVSALMSVSMSAALSSPPPPLPPKLPYGHRSGAQLHPPASAAVSASASTSTAFQFQYSPMGAAASSASAATPTPTSTSIQSRGPAPVPVCVCHLELHYPRLLNENSSSRLSAGRLLASHCSQSAVVQAVEPSECTVLYCTQWLHSSLTLE